VDINVQRLRDTDQVPVWDAQAGQVVTRDASTLRGEPLFIVVQGPVNPVGATIARDAVVVVEEGSFQTGPGREARRILAFLTSEDQARACIDALRSAKKRAGIGIQVASSVQSDILKLFMADGPITAELVPKQKQMAMLTKLDVDWFNCGRTVSSLNIYLGALGARLEPQKELCGRYLADDLPKFLSIFGKRPRGTVLIDCTIDIHTFMIELQPDAIYLIQGYQAAYSAFWWLNLAERPDDLALGHDASGLQIAAARRALEPTRAMRNVVGCGRLLDLDTFGTHVLIPLRTMFAEGTWTERARALWKLLPFFAGEKKFLGPQTPISLQVTVSEVTNASTLFNRLGSAPPASLCGLVIGRCNTLYSQLQELKDRD
jgi:hypothetical protein